MRNLDLMMTLTGVSLTLAAGCGQTEFSAALGTTLEQVDRIRNDDSLEPQEKRAALAQFGLDPVTINGLLQQERLGNQFGGDLSSAFDKVINEQLTEMTPDELQFYGDATDVTTYNDTEAQAIVDLLNDNNVNAPGELEDFLDDPATELPAAIDEANLRGVFIDTSVDDVRDKLL